MKRSKQTKKALTSSVLALVLCFVMLLGTTFAWFTDNASTSVNKVQAGNLDIEVYYATPSDLVEGKIPDENWKVISADQSVFKDGALWEPGYTEIVYFKFVNKGNLALKYRFNVDILKEVAGKNKAGNDFYLSDYIQSYVAIDPDGISITTRELAHDPSSLYGNGAMPEVFHDTLKNAAGYEPANSNGDGNVLALDSEGALLAGASTYATLVLWMPETVGNEANHDGEHVPSIDLGINVLATQYTYESDSNGTDYDKNAEYPTYVTSGLDTSSSTSSNKGDLSEVIAGVENGYRVNGGSYVASGTLLTFEETYDSVLVNDAEIVCDTLVVLDEENTVILQNCDITIAKGGKLVVNNTGRYQQICFSHVTINGVAVTSENVSSIVSTYCTGELTGMVY